MRAALPVMKAQGAGTIITVSSGAAVNPMEGWGAYCSSKAGALMLTRALHLEEGANGIRALGLSPGTVATEMQVKIKASGVNPVSALDPSVHISADWPARALLAVGTGLVVVHLALGLTAFGSAMTDFYQQQSGTDALLFVERQFGRDPAAIAALLEQGREAFSTPPTAAAATCAPCSWPRSD